MGRSVDWLRFDGRPDGRCSVDRARRTDSDDVGHHDDHDHFNDAAADEYDGTTDEHHDDADDHDDADNHDVDNSERADDADNHDVDDRGEYDDDNSEQHDDVRRPYRG